MAKTKEQSLVKFRNSKIFTGDFFVWYIGQTAIGSFTADELYLTKLFIYHEPKSNKNG